MKIFLCHGILANIGSLNKTLNHKLYKTTLKKFKKSIDFSQNMWYYNIKERGKTKVPTDMADTEEISLT